MADQKSRGGKKMGAEKQTSGKRHLGTHGNGGMGKKTHGQIDQNNTKSRGNYR